MPGPRPLLAGLLSVALVGLGAPSVLAQETGDPVTAEGKGTVGGLLLGAETILLAEAAIGVRPAWAYLVGGVVGAAGGAAAGYHAERQASPRVNVYLLAGGMALVIPTTIAVLSRTAYHPAVEFTQDSPPADEPVAEPPPPAPILGGGGGSRRGAGERVRQARRLPSAAPARPPALFGLGEGTLALGVPALQVRESLSQRERFELDLAGGPTPGRAAPGRAVLGRAVLGRAAPGRAACSLEVRLPLFVASF